MFWKGLRWLIGSTDTDVATGTIANGQVVQYNSTSNTLEGITPGSGGVGDVVGPGSSTDNHVARFHLATGKVIQDGTNVTIDDSSNISGVGTLNTRTIANFTESSSSFANDNRLVRTDGTARAVQQSGITVDDSNNVSGMGTLSCGNVTSGTVNSVDVANHDARHLPGGADSMFAGTWANNDLPLWDGAQFNPKQRSFRRIHGANQTSTSTSYADISNLDCPINRTGQYTFQYTVFYTTSAAAEGAGFQLNFTGSVGGLNYSVDQFLTTTTKAALKTSGTFGSGLAVETTGPGATTVVVYISGAMNVTATGTLSVQFRAETGGANSVTAYVGSWGQISAL